MTEKRQLKAWYLWCGLVCLACLSATFIWRSSMMLVVCLSPCIGVICLTAMVIYLVKVEFHLKHALFGFLAVLICFVVGAESDGFARETIFRWNLHGYRHTVSEVLKNPPKQKGYLPEELLSGFGMHSAKYEKNDGVTRIEFYTHSGPTLEAVVFSTKPLPTSEGLYVFKTKDEQGYWYDMHFS